MRKNRVPSPVWGRPSACGGLSAGIAWLSYSLMAFAQTAPATGPLTLAEAEAMALKNHPQIAAAASEAGAAARRVVEEKAALYPTIAGEVTGSQAYDESRLGAGALTDSLLYNRFGTGLQANQLITDFGRTGNLIASSRLQQQAAEQTVTATRYDIALGVYRSYFGVLQSQAFLRVAEDTVKARQTLLDQIGALAGAQLKSQVDVSLQQVNVADAKLLEIRTEDTLKRAYADLGRALGQDGPVAYTLVEQTGSPAPPLDAEPLIAEAIQNRPELHELRLRLEAAKKFEAAERDLKRPIVAAIAVGGVLPYLDQTPRVTPKEYEGVAVNVDIPIFNGHLFSAREQAARYEAQASDQRLRNLRQQVERDVRAAWAEASTAWQRIPVTEQMIKEARLGLDLAQGRYNLGLASIVEITQAELNLTQARIENVTARYDYETAYAALEYATGALR